MVKHTEWMWLVRKAMSHLFVKLEWTNRLCFSLYSCVLGLHSFQKKKIDAIALVNLIDGQITMGGTFIASHVDEHWSIINLFIVSTCFTSLLLAVQTESVDSSIVTHWLTHFWFWNIWHVIECQKVTQETFLDNLLIFLLTIFTIFNNFDNFWQFWQFFTNF